MSVFLNRLDRVPGSGTRGWNPRNSGTPELVIRMMFQAPYRRGPVAQLGARLNGIQEVTGSILVRSTISKSLI